MEKLQEECKQYLTSDFVFKRCSEYIIFLKKPLLKFQCNENRSGVIDKKYAKFRCNGLFVEDIIDCETLTHICKHNHKSAIFDIVYEVGTFVKPDSYNPNIQKICTNGIHYFLSLKAAYYYEYEAK